MPGPYICSECKKPLMYWHLLAKQGFFCMNPDCSKKLVI